MRFPIVALIVLIACAQTTKAATTELPTMGPTTTWKLKDCLLAQFDLTFSGTYEFSNNSQGTFMFALPQNAAVSEDLSSCGTDSKPAILALTFDDNLFILQFTKASNMYKLSSAVANLTLDPAHFPDSKNKGVVKYGGLPGEDFFSAKVGDSFKCASKEEIAFKTNDFKLQFSNLKLQPFVTGGKFGNEHECFADDPGHWFLKNDKGEVCFVADFELEFQGMYETTKKQQKQFSFKLPQDATVDKAESKCALTKLGDTATEEAMLTLKTVGGDTFIQVFTADPKKKSYSLTNATAMLMHSEGHFPDSNMKDKVVTYGGTVPHAALQADLGSYFKCNGSENVMFNDENKFDLNYSEIKIQPFDVNGKLGKKHECFEDDPGHWFLKNEMGEVCIVADFDLEFQGMYETTKKQQKQFSFKLPQDATVDKAESKCALTKLGDTATEEAMLTLKTVGGDTFIQVFTADPEKKSYSLTNATAMLIHSEGHFPDSDMKDKVVTYGGTVPHAALQADLGSYFKCNGSENVMFNDENKFDLNYSEIKIQPFDVNGKLGKKHECFEDDPGHWFLKNDKGEVCIVADFELEFQGMYETTKKQQKQFSFKLPQDATVDKAESKCAPTKLGDTATEEAMLTLKTVGGDTFIQVFTADPEKKSYSLTNATAMLIHSEGHFPDSNIKDQVVTYGGTVPHAALQADLGSYFKCNANENVMFNGKNKFDLNYSEIKIQPFDVNGRLGNMSECKADTPTVKPAGPPVGNWTISNKDGKCMLMDFGAEFFISYKMANKTAAKAGFFFPNDIKLVQLDESSCTNTMAVFKAVFNPDKTDLSIEWVMSMEFKMDVKEKMYEMTNFSLKYIEDSKYFPGVNENKTITAMNTIGHFKTPSSSYYMCTSEQSFSASQVEVSFTDVKFQPFAQTVDEKGTFGTEHECFADDPGHWFLKNDKGEVCIVADFELEFQGMYETTKKQQKPFSFKLPQNATVDKAESKCALTKLGDTAAEEAMLTLKTVGGDTFIQVFTADPKKKSYSLTNATAMLNHSEDHFPDTNMKDKVVTYGGTVPHAALQADLGSYFNCNGSENVMFNDKTKFDLNYSEIKIQPFDVNGKLGKKHECFEDDPGHWFLKNDKGEVCIVADFDLEFQGMYETTKKKQKPFSFKLPQNATVDKAESKCALTKLGDTAAEEAMLTLKTVGGDTFIQVFTADPKKKSYSLTNATAMLRHSEGHFPDSNTKDKVVTYGGTVPHAALQTDLGSYFKCNANENVMFNDKNKFELSYSETKIQPFVNGWLGKMSECKADTPTVTPAGPPVGNWTISNKDGKCMLMHFGAEFFISYKMANKTAAKAGFFFPNDTKLVQLNESSCTNTMAVFKAVFNPDTTDLSIQWVMTLEFKMDVKAKMYNMSNFSLKYIEDSKYFPGSSETNKTITATNTTGHFKTSSGSYYMCTTEQSFNALQVEVAFTDIKFQPFAQTVAKKGTFGIANECSADNDVSNIVPIAVGCALAGLVIIVLIAYLIGRSRTNRSGYQSV